MAVAGEAILEVEYKDRRTKAWLTDHRPIVQLFSKPIDALFNRLQR